MDKYFNEMKRNYEEKNEVYNKLFLMAVYILQAQNVQDFKDEMKQMREKASEKSQ